MTDKSELLPCPFCGGKAEHEVWSDHNFSRITCDDCGLERDYLANPDEAYTWWNTRAAPAEDVRATTYDPAKENKDFEAWARTQSMVSLRLCDIGLYYDRQTGLAHDAWQHRAKFAEDVREVVDEPVLPELTSDLREILGRPNFTCHFIAKALRLMGFDIPQKSEEEQAVTIYWMLGHYLRDPVNWRDAASAELKAGAAAQPGQQ